MNSIIWLLTDGKLKPFPHYADHYETQKNVGWIGFRDHKV